MRHRVLPRKFLRRGFPPLPGLHRRLKLAPGPCVSPSVLRLQNLSSPFRRQRRQKLAPGPCVSPSVLRFQNLSSPFRRQRNVSSAMKSLKKIQVLPLVLFLWPFRPSPDCSLGCACISRFSNCVQPWPLFFDLPQVASRRKRRGESPLKSCC